MYNVVLIMLYDIFSGKKVSVSRHYLNQTKGFFFCCCCCFFWSGSIILLISQIGNTLDELRIDHMFDDENNTDITLHNTSVLFQKDSVPALSKHTWQYLNKNCPFVRLINLFLNHSGWLICIWYIVLLWHFLLIPPDQCSLFFCLFVCFLKNCSYISKY